jgi:hypothetical protein
VNDQGSIPLSLDTFQQRVDPFMLACFGREIADDIKERNHRFLEESLEYVQSTGCTLSEAIQLALYVFSRPIGEPIQEAGGVAVTFAALCNAIRINISEAAERELARIWTVLPKIRAKQAAKPKHSPLPQHTEAPEFTDEDARALLDEIGAGNEENRLTTAERVLILKNAFESRLAAALLAATAKTPAPAPAPAPAPKLAHDMDAGVREAILGMTVSVDVSTGDDDATRRYFGTVTELMDSSGDDKNGVTLLVQDAEPNFSTDTEPVPMILLCPSCNLQHIDAPKGAWKNPPHKSHLCHHCGSIWRPADTPTYGVASIETKGKKDHLVRRIESAEKAEDLVQRAFDIGFEWRHALTGHVHDSRDVGRTLIMRCFDGLAVDPNALGGLPLPDKDHAIVLAKAEIKRALVASLARAPLHQPRLDQ